MPLSNIQQSCKRRVFHIKGNGIKVFLSPRIVKPDGTKILGVYGAGEVNGGVHGLNRLGGSSLLDCVVFGRVAGASAAAYLLSETLKRPAAVGYQGAIQSNVRFDPQSKRVSVDFSWDNELSASTPVPVAPKAAAPVSAPSPPSSVPTVQPYDKPDRNKVWTMEEVAKHNKKDDCWVVVNGQVLNTTKFLPDHPGGAKAILLYAGKDATEEFNMLHEPSVIEKYAPDVIIGKIKK